MPDSASRNIPTFESLRRGGNLKEIDGLSGEELELLQADLRDRKAALKNDEAFFTILLKDRFGVNIQEHFDHETKDTGTIRFGIGDGKEVKAVRRKVVIWDQTKLAALWKRIAEHEDPAVYIKREESVSYTVPENAYKEWPETVQAAFTEARTVKPSEPVITIETAKKE